MATETELESLVVRLTGDGSEYSKMLKQMMDETKESTDKVTGFIDKIGSYASQTASALASLGIKQVMDEALGNFREAESIGIDLNATLQANSRNVEQLTEQYKKQAEALEKTTTLEDDYILSLFEKAETFKATGAQAEKAVKDAIYLGSATKQSADAVIKLTAALARNDVEGAQKFARMIPQLKGIKNEMKFVEEANKLIAIGMKKTEAEMHSSAGVLKILKRDWGNLLEIFGEVIADAIHPVIMGLTDLVNWMKTWDQQTVLIITTVAGLVAGFLALGPALSVLGVVAGLVFNPIVALIAAAGVAVGLWVDKMGGVSEAWKYVIQTGTDAYDFFMKAYDDLVTELKPVTDALLSLWRTVKDVGIQAWNAVVSVASDAWERLKTAASVAGGWISDVWERMTGGALSSWGQVRDKLQEVILFAEFTIKHFGQVWEFVWTGIKLYAVKALNAVLENLFLILAGPALAALAAAFSVNWRGMFDAAADYLKQFDEFVVGKFIAIGIAIRDALSGKDVNWDEIKKEFEGNFKFNFKGIEVPALKQLQDDLQQEFDDLGAALGGDFAQFAENWRRDQAWWADAFPEDDVAEAEKKAENTGERIAGKFEKGEGKFDAAARNSVEALGRVQEYLDRMKFKEAGELVKDNRSKTPTSKFEASPRNSPEALQKQDAQTELLKKLVVLNERIADKTTIDVSAMNLDA